MLCKEPPVAKEGARGQPQRYGEPARQPSLEVCRILPFEDLATQRSEQGRVRRDKKTMRDRLLRARSGADLIYNPQPRLLAQGNNQPDAVRTTVAFINIEPVTNPVGCIRVWTIALQRECAGVGSSKNPLKQKTHLCRSIFAGPGNGSHINRDPPVSKD